MKLIVERQVAANCWLAEAPTWHAAESCVYWTDIKRRRLHRYCVATGKHDIVLNDRRVAGMTLQADGSLLLFGVMGAIDRWQSSQSQSVLPARWRRYGYRYNDVVADPQGRVLAGAIGFDEPRRRLLGVRRCERLLQRVGLISQAKERSGIIYQVDTGGIETPMFDNIRQPNGMAFTPDSQRLYVTDTARTEIRVFEQDTSSGKLVDGGQFVNASAQRGRPDGLAVDVDGGVWSVQHGGGCILRYDEHGRLTDRFELPTKHPTSLAFGGSDGRDLFVTSSGGARQAAGSVDGALFVMRAEVAGQPVWPSRVLLGVDS